MRRSRESFYGRVSHEVGARGASAGEPSARPERRPRAAASDQQEGGAISERQRVSFGSPFEPGEIRPAATMVVVADLLDPRWHVEIEAEAIVG